MSWVRIRYRADRSSGNAVSEALDACGAIAVTLENAGDKDFLDAATPEDPGWTDVFVSGLFPGDVDTDGVIAWVAERVGGSAASPLGIDVVADQDWARSWARDYRPVRVAERLWVCPSWIDPPSADAVTVVMDPGLAFGTGTHPTTRLCLQWLARADLRGNRVIDYGCGSGILAIAAVKLGAAHAWALDIDPHALAATRYNAERNGVQDRITVGTCLEPSKESADVVIANILANVIVSLRDTLCGLVRPRGQLLLTGILNAQAERVVQKFEGRFQFEIQRRDDWCLLVGRAVP